MQGEKLYAVDSMQWAVEEGYQNTVDGKVYQSIRTSVRGAKDYQDITISRYQSSRDNLAQI